MECKSFFDIMKIILDKKPYPSLEDIEKHTSQWMLLQYFSCSPMLAELAQELSKLKLSNKEFFDVCYYGIPKMNSFIKYNAKKNKKEENIKFLMDYYGCSQLNAKTYVTIISSEEMEHIREYYLNRGLKK